MAAKQYGYQKEREGYSIWTLGLSGSRQDVIGYARTARDAQRKINNLHAVDEAALKQHLSRDPKTRHHATKKSSTYVVKSFRDRELNAEMPTLVLAKGTARDLARMPLRWKKEEARYGSADSPIRTTYYSDGDYYIELRF